MWTVYALTGALLLLSAARLLRTTSDASVDLHSCESYTSPAACSAAQCSWCVSSAVPSKCFSHEDAHSLPPGVFNCDVSSSKHELHVSEGTRSAGCDPSVNQRSGYFRILDQDKHYFFWQFDSRRDPDKDPLVLWLNGGPGCSSMLGLLTENGPCRIDKSTQQPHTWEHSWNAHANVIFVDQPTGVGFSHGTDKDSDEVGVGDDMNAFLREFLIKFPIFQNRPFYIFAESYGGHYAPAISHRVWRGNKDGESPFVNLRGVGIGNGLVDPLRQYPFYSEMAYNSGSNAPRVISKLTYAAMRASLPACLHLIKKCDSTKSKSVCSSAMQFCGATQEAPVTATGVNPYDLRIRCEVPGLCYDFSQVDAYLNNESTKASLGVDPKVKWEQCDYGVNAAFRGDFTRSYENMLPELLEDGIRVLVYVGDVDWICNYLGNEAWLKALEWKGKSEFNSKNTSPFVVDGRSVGETKTAQTLTWLRIYDAGHMVPTDQPRAAAEMLRWFIGAKE